MARDIKKNNDVERFDVYFRIGDYEIKSSAWVFVLVLATFVLVFAVLALNVELRRDLVCLATDAKAQCTLYRDQSVAAASSSEVDLAPVSCTINNPSGRPINVRSEPNGADVGDLPNGTSLSILGTKKDSQGRLWGMTDAGYVFMDLLSCPANAEFSVLD